MSTKTTEQPWVDGHGFIIFQEVLHICLYFTNINIF